jgi:hypothetical protein
VDSQTAVKECAEGRLLQAKTIKLQAISMAVVEIFK